LVVASMAKAIILEEKKIESKDFFRKGGLGLLECRIHNTVYCTVHVKNITAPRIFLQRTINFLGNKMHPLKLF
jgi:hypothetical protein